ncbi:MAG: RNA polymerase factor sigma-54, partial [Planctomycetota bacterium]
MRLEASLQQRLSQQMRLAPQIIQSIEILQLASLDLQDLIQQELVDNPVLEIIEGSTTSESGAESDGNVDSPDGPELKAEGPTLEDPRTAEDDRISKEFEKLVEMEGDAGYNELFGAQRAAPASGEKDRKLEAMQNSPARAASLSEYLYEQFGLRDGMNERLRDLGREIIFNLDERGFLRYQLREIFDITDEDPEVGAAAEPSLAIGLLTNPAPAPATAPAETAPRVESIAAAVTNADDTAGVLAATRHESGVDGDEEEANGHGEAAAALASPESLGPAPVPAIPATSAGQLSCTRAEANDALRAVQQLEPRGVGARSLQECLLLQ